MKINKPWGTYEIILSDINYQVKKLVINPAQSISLQSHIHRSEHWIVVSGIANVILGNQSNQMEVQTGEHIFIGKEEIHRMENKSNVKLVVIEIQQGVYLGEDDITRFSDRYCRT
ncbi:MAG: mannose-6-phosphate isomerase [Rhodospirillaceae bacterium]|nr:mannose-6-phosphate isomerase [Rhodospirillaceae bacterium]